MVSLELLASHTLSLIILLLFLFLFFLIFILVFLSLSFLTLNLPFALLNPSINASFSLLKISYAALQFLRHAQLLWTFILNNLRLDFEETHCLERKFSLFGHLSKVEVPLLLNGLFGNCSFFALLVDAFGESGNYVVEVCLYCLVLISLSLLLRE